MQREARSTNRKSRALYSSRRLLWCNFLPADKFNDPVEPAWLETVERAISSKMFLYVIYQSHVGAFVDLVHE